MRGMQASPLLSEFCTILVLKLERKTCPFMGFLHFETYVNVSRTKQIVYNIVDGCFSGCVCRAGFHCTNYLPID